MASVIRGVSPCKGCEFKLPGCHDRCGRYQAWRSEVDRVNEARRNYHPVNMDKEQWEWKYVHTKIKNGG